MEEDKMIFAPEEEKNLLEGKKKKEVWKVMIVDDEPDVHSITRIALEDFIYKDKKIEFIDTYTAAESEEVLLMHNDIAVVILDVVMETVHAGLGLVKIIREKHRNSIVRIILRTGQAGQAPEKDVIRAYEIDDYKTKTELTNVRLFTVIFASIRAYETMKQLNDYSRNLEEKVAERTKEITDSIRYAGHLQKAIFTPHETIAGLFSEYFILFKPCDIVSGDFYWFHKTESKVYFTVADCTGHGVPGAIMSMLGIALLNEIVINNRFIPANEVLNELRKNIIKALHQQGRSGESRDGIDMIMCIYEPSNKRLQYAAANNSILIFNGKQFIETTCDTMPVGYYENMKSFKNHETDLTVGDCLYLLTDGYADQFGGPKDKKFMSKRLKELLLEISDKPMKQQHEILDQTITYWMTGHEEKYEQTDDITIMGIKI